MKYLFALMCLICSIPSFASNPWDSLLTNNKKVTPNFKNQSAHFINNWLTKSSGIPVLMDPSFNKPISMNSVTSISLSQAFEMYNQMLNFHNYEITKENKWLVIKPIVKKIEPLKDQLTNQNTIQEEQNAEIKVIKLKNNNSSNVARLINELFSTPSFKIEDFIWRTNLNDTIRPGR